MPGYVTAQTKPKKQQSVTYSCPMHPDFKSKKPGRCPKCGMTLRLDTPAPQPSPSPADATTAFSSLQIPNVRVYDQNGRLIQADTDFLISNDYVIKTAQAHPNEFLAGVSINPQRRDAVEEVHRCADAGASICSSSACGS